MMDGRVVYCQDCKSVYCLSTVALNTGFTVINTETLQPVKNGEEGIVLNVGFHPQENKKPNS